MIIAAMPNLVTGTGLALLILFGMSLRAYLTSQYIKIGERVIAFHSATDLSKRQDDVAELGVDEPYSPSVSAAKL